MKKYIKYLLTIIVLGIGFGFYQYHKPHKNMQKADAHYEMQAAALFAEFEKDEVMAEQKYLDQIIQVSGVISNVSKKEDGSQTITLESDDLIFGVLCELDPFSKHPKTELKSGDPISLKGICSGMLSDVVLVRCVIL